MFVWLSPFLGMVTFCAAGYSIIQFSKGISQSLRNVGLPSLSFNGRLIISLEGRERSSAMAMMYEYVFYHCPALPNPVNGSEGQGTAT